MPKTVMVDDLIAALQSGEYPKTRGRLWLPEQPTWKSGYCCIGVACRLAGVDLDDGGEDDNPYTFVDHDGVLTEDQSVGSAPEWAPWLDGELQSELADINDSNDTFAEVIEILEFFKAVEQMDDDDVEALRELDRA